MAGSDYKEQCGDRVRKRRWFLITTILLLAIVGGFVLVVTKPPSAPSFVPAWVTSERQVGRRTTLVEFPTTSSTTIQTTTWMLSIPFEQVRLRLKKELVKGWSVWGTPEGDRVWFSNQGSLTVKNRGSQTLIDIQTNHDTTWQDWIRQWIQDVSGAGKAKSE